MGTLWVFSLLAGLASLVQPLSAGATAPLNSIPDLIKPYGYHVEHHTVQTEDGFILSLFRIPAGHNKTTGHQHDSTARAPVVFLQHGLLDSCAGFVLQGPQHGLAFLLADAGFDVWLGNSRGSTQSRTHAWLPPSSADFWAFSFDEMAQYDLPASLAYVRNITQQAKVAFVSHSQGGTVMLAALASQPQLAEHLGLMALMAPVYTAHHASSVPLQALAALGTDGMFTLLGVHEFLPSVRLISWLEGQLCQHEPALCVSILAAICGYRRNAVDMDKLPLYLEYTPAGTSVQNIVHWAQNLRGGATPGRPGLTYFDYGNVCDFPTAQNQNHTEHAPTASIRRRLRAAKAGDAQRMRAPAVHDDVHDLPRDGSSLGGKGSPARERHGGKVHARVGRSPPARRTCNQKVYGSAEPPIYHMSNIPSTTRIIMFTGGADRLADPLDVELMLEAMPQDVVVAHHYDADLEHLDYIWGQDACSRIYTKIVDALVADVAQQQQHQQQAQLGAGANSRQQQQK